MAPTATPPPPAIPRNRENRVDAPRWVFPAAVLPVLFTILGFGGVYSYIWVPAALSLFIATALLLWWQARAGGNLTWNPVLVPMLGFSLIAALQWIFKLSIYPGSTLTELVQLAACGCVFYLSLTAMSNRGAIDRLARLLWMFTGALSGEALVQFFTAGKYIYWFHDATYATPVGPFVYHNHYGGCLALLLPLSAAVSFLPSARGDGSWAGRIQRALVLALGLSSVVISLSRGAMLAVCVEAILSFFVFWKLLTGTRRAQITTLAGVVAMASFILLANIHPMLARFEHLSNHVNHFTRRVAVTESALRIFRDHPWTGTGLATFAVEYPRYKTFDDKRTPYAHDDYAQALSETGIAGAICILGFLFYWTRDFLRCWLRRSSRRALLQLSMFIGTAGFLFHSFGDFQFHAPANALLFYLMAGAALAGTGKSAERKGSVHPYSR